MEPTRYRITVRGRLTKRLMPAFDGLDVEPGVAESVDVWLDVELKVALRLGLDVELGVGVTVAVAVHETVGVPLCVVLKVMVGL